MTIHIHFGRPRFRFFFLHMIFRNRTNLDLPVNSVMKHFSCWLSKWNNLWHSNAGDWIQIWNTNLCITNGRRVSTITEVVALIWIFYKSQKNMTWHETNFSKSTHTKIKCHNTLDLRHLQTLPTDCHVACISENERTLECRWPLFAGP